MPSHDARDTELQLHTLIHRGQWTQALAAVDEWLAQEPWRIELLLRRAQILRAQRQYEQGLAAVRAYRVQKPSSTETIFLEIEFLLELQRVEEAEGVLRELPPAQQDSAQGQYYWGRVMLARRDIHNGLQALWTAYQREPGFHRTLLEWASHAARHYGKRRVRRQLEQLLARHADDPAIAVSVGLALSSVDAHHGRSILRHAVDRRPESPLLTTRRMQRRQEDAEGQARRTREAAEAYRTASELILSGRFHEAIDAYYRAVNDDPVWMPVLAPLIAEILVDELVRPEEARLIVEEALRREGSNYRLHISHTKVFLKLGFGDEAISSANCALSLAPETEKAIALVLRAGAHVLRKSLDPALHDLSRAVKRMPEVRSLIAAEPTLRPLARHPEFRALMAGEAPPAPETFWERLKQWLSGQQS